MIREFVFQSSILGAPHRSLIFLSDRFEKRSDPIPVLYLFRGLADEWFALPAERRGQNLETVVHDLAGAGSLEPLLIVCPDTTAVAGNAEVATAGFDLFDPPSAEVPSVGTGRFRAFFLEEYFEHIEEEVFGGKGRVARAVGGFSLGSVAAFGLAFARPDLFVAASSFDGAFLYWDHDRPGGSGPPENDLRLDLFPHWFGSPPSHDRFLEQNPHSLLKAADSARRSEIRRLAFFQHASAEVHSTANGWREEKMREALLDLGCTQGFGDGLLSPDSRHDWFWVDEHLCRLLPKVAALLWRELRSELRSPHERAKRKRPA